MSAKKQTAITQVHSYIQEHFVPADVISVNSIIPGMRHLTYSSISASMWKLAKEEILICIDKKGPQGCNEYMVNDTYLERRGFEDREAPEPGAKRKRKKKKEKEISSLIKSYTETQHGT